VRHEDLGVGERGRDIGPASVQPEGFRTSAAGACLARTALVELGVRQLYANLSFPPVRFSDLVGSR
jgi:hypothetical protein